MDENGVIDYFSWLCTQTQAPVAANRKRTYWSLLGQLHTKSFRWFVGNDENRNEDGVLLREEYRDTFDLEEEPDQPDFPASILEVFIALSRRVAYESYGTPAEWFWLFIENLGLKQYVDAGYTPHAAEAVDIALEIFLDRRYNRDGVGGIFPLNSTRIDQRKTEIWYQSQQYLLESNAVANGP